MKITISSCSHPSHPVKLIKGFVSYSNGMVEKFKNRHNMGCWGNPYPYIIESDNESIEPPIEILAIWISLENRKKFMVDERLPSDLILNTNENDFDNIVLGFGPCEGFSMWCYSDKKSVMIKNTINPISDIANYMKQFHYRYLILYERWEMNEEKWGKYTIDEEEPEFGYIKEELFDSTHDKLQDGGLLKYHQAGKPKKLAIKWYIGKSEYSAYLWFEDERIREVFDKFYGAHPDTKTDFIIRIDAENRKYELALYRYGLKEPQVISEDVYQLLVFKNKFEDYRSDNYNQERGAWIW